MSLLPTPVRRRFRRTALAVATALLAGSARPAAAVIINTLSGTDNTTAPADDPGFANVGYSLNGHGTAIYLGEGWVLTAGHVGPGGIVLASGTYLQASGSNTDFTLVNTTLGATPYTDLCMYKLATTPVGLPTLRIASSMPALGEAVTMIGAGLDRGASEQWFVTTSSTAAWTWTPVESGGNFAGYGTLESRAVRWGTNTVDDNDFWVKAYWGPGPTDYNDVRSLATVFDGLAGPNEAQAVLFDSGGAVFTKAGGQWELAGVMYAVVGYPDQPLPEFNAVFGDATLIADLSYYRPQIVAVVPEPSGVAIAGLAMAVLGVCRPAFRRRRG